MTLSFKHLRVGVLSWLLALSLAVAAVGQEPAMDNPMSRDPDLTEPPAAVVLSPRLKPMWLEALTQPDAWTRQQALEAFASAHEQGMPDVPALAPQFIEQLSKPDQHPLVKLEAARTLARIDASSAAEAMFQASLEGDATLALVIDPALARWNHAPARELWVQRAKDTAAAMPVRISAARSLATVKHAAAAPTLKALALDERTDPTLRLAAATALGQLVEQGLESDAQALLARGSLVDRLAAARLLGGHTAAGDLLVKIAGDAEPAVAVIAAQRLLDTQPTRLAALADRFAKSTDGNLRHLVVRLDQQQPSATSVARLAMLLDDEDTLIRTAARQAMASLAAASQWSDPVRSAALTALSGKGWRTQEQAALLLGELDHEPAADALLALLTHERHEVRLASIIALRQLAVMGTLPALRSHLERLMAGPIHPAPATPPEPKPAAGKKLTPQQIEQHKLDVAAAAMLRSAIDMHRGAELSHLVQAFGLMKDADAQPLLRKFVPKNAVVPLARAAAVWSLGLLHADQPDPALVRELLGRFNDSQGMEPEGEDVRAQAAVALGRMKAKNAANAINSTLTTGAGGPLGVACIWAITQITGKPPTLPDAPPAPTGSGWFLEPIE